MNPTRCPVVLALVATWVACSTLVGPQGWDEDHGPVVPHDSFPADCTLCHEGTDWHTIRPDFAFDHGARTGVELHGAHGSASCLRCHNDRGPAAKYAARGCAGCHVDPHRGELGADCTDCHGENDWRPTAAIERHAATRMPLVGAHLAVACFACHPGAQVGNFGGLDPACVSCHRDDIRNAATLDHQALGWTTDCQRCHLPRAWQPARFGHPPNFPLTDGHGGLVCSRCHTTPGTFTGLSTDCVSCHLGDYQNTRNPSHTAAGFGTSCAQCHGTKAWGDGQFVHRFPLSGPHGGLNCSDCHTTPGNFGAFSCIDCHEHSQSRMGDKHKEVGGYVWASASCVRCHPNGRH